MKKFENVYQDAALMRKVLLGEADEVEQKDKILRNGWQNVRTYEMYTSSYRAGRL